MRTSNRLTFASLLLLAAVLHGCGEELVVQQTFPMGGETEIPVPNVVSVEFNMNLDPATVTGSSFYVEREGVRVEGTLSVVNAVATFTPAQPFQRPATYAATVTTQVASVAGDELSQSLTWRFSTDATPPSVVSVSPAEGTENLRPDARFEVTFNEVIDPTSAAGAITLRLYSFPFSLERGTISVGAGEKSIIFTPSAPIPAGLHELEIRNVRDRSGNQQPLPVYFVYAVGMGDVLSMALSAPLDGSIHVAPDVTIKAESNLSLDSRSVTAQASAGPCTGTVQLSPDGFNTCVPGVASTTVAGLQLKPAAPLALGTTYRLRLTTELRSRTNRPLPATVEMATGFRTYRVANEKAFFVTTEHFTGNLGGAAGADAKCAADAGGRWGNGGTPVYKALLVGGGRTACSVPNCGPGSTSTDWVLPPNRRYIRGDGAVLFDTDARGLLPGPVATSIMAGGNFWDGFAYSGGPTWIDFTTGPETCLGWTSDSDSNNGGVGWSGSPSDSQSWLIGGALGCNSSLPIVCVEQ